MSRYLGHAQKFIWLTPGQPPTMVEESTVHLPDRAAAYDWHAALGKQFFDEKDQKYFYTGYITPVEEDQ